MLEILFRGKRIDNGEFVYGYVGVFKGTTQIYVPFTEEEEKENEGHIFSAIGGLWYTVNPATVGQFTGLTDKNGKKIFEGDIVDVDGDVYACRWDEGNFEFGLVSKDVSFGIAYATIDQVIGNIHDNPDLLNK